jgi:hypothetical protein
MDKLNRFVDADVLGEYANATSDVDDGEIFAVKKLGYMLEHLVRSFVLMPTMA